MTRVFSTTNNKTGLNIFNKAALILVSCLLISPTFAADSAHHTSKAGKHSALAVSAGAASTAKVASAVVAVPLVAAGSTMVVAGTLSAEAGSKMLDSASNHNDELVISDLTITADPAPQTVMQKNTVKTTKTTVTTQTRVRTKEQK